MMFELATFLLGICVGIVIVLIAAQEGYLEHRWRKTSIELMASLQTPPPKAPFIPIMDQAVEVPSAVPTTSAEPAPPPSVAPPTYETVQPSPATMQYSAPPTTSLRAQTLTSPTRTYRRRMAPVRSASASMVSLGPKRKKSPSEKTS